MIIRLFVPNSGFISKRKNDQFQYIRDRLIPAIGGITKSRIDSKAEEYVVKLREADEQLQQLDVAEDTNDATAATYE